MDTKSLPKGFFKTLKIIYGSLIFGVFLFTALTYLSIKKIVPNVDGNMMFVVGIPIVSVAGILMSNLLYASILRKITSNDDLQKKLSRYLTANLLRAVFLEIPAFLSIAATFISGNVVFLFAALMMALMMYFKFPSKEKFAAEVTLNRKEKTELDTL